MNNLEKELTGKLRILGSLQTKLMLIEDVDTDRHAELEKRIGLVYADCIRLEKMTIFL